MGDCGLVENGSSSSVHSVTVSTPSILETFHDEEERDEEIDDEVLSMTSSLSLGGENRSTNQEEDRVSSVSSEKARMIEATRTLLTGLVGQERLETEDGLRDTPERMTKALLSLTSGYHTSVKEQVGRGIFDASGCGEDIVVVKNIEFFSLCEHHVLPFFGKVSIAYLPQNRILGLSKFARVVNIFARRLQVQERLTRQIAEAIDEVIQPRGVAVYCEATHLCMAMRGVEKPDSVTSTVYCTGVFREEKRRAEFLSMTGAFSR